MTRKRPYITIVDTETVRRVSVILRNLEMQLVDPEAFAGLVGSFNASEVQMLANRLMEELEQRTF